jgi:hypothetical protein
MVTLYVLLYHAIKTWYNLFVKDVKNNNKSNKIEYIKY